VLTAEDVIVQKLIAWPARDQDDVLPILSAGHRLDTAYIDTAYIEGCARAWDVSYRWELAKRSS